MSEILQGASDDIRGLMWTDDPGGGSYMTRFAPNGYLDSLNAGINMDNLPTFASSAVGKPAQPRLALRQSTRPGIGLLQPGNRREASTWRRAAGIPAASTPSSATDLSTS